MFPMLPDKYKNSIIRSVTVDVTGVASTIVQTTAKQGKQSQPTFVLGFMFTETTSTQENDATIKATVDSVDIVSLNCQHYLQEFDSSVSQVSRYVPVMVNLGTGAEFKIGHLSGTTLSNFSYTVFFVYENDRDNFVQGNQ